MPRTKHVRESQEDRTSIECDTLIQNFKQKAASRISKMGADSLLAIKSFQKSVDIAVSGLSPNYRRMTLGEILNLELNKANDVDEFTLPPPTTVKKKTKRITSTSDDGYITEGIQTTRASRTRTVDTSKRRTRSSSRATKRSEIIQASVKRTVGRQNKESTVLNQFKTPLAVRTQVNDYGIITPKIKPNAPVNILRHPRQGETVFSTQGSPLLVSTVVQENIANINIPLHNGNIMSLLPKDGLRMSHIPALDPDMVKQLKTLKSHIEKVVGYK